MPIATRIEANVCRRLCGVIPSESVDAGAPVTSLTSTGVAIAEHELLVAAGGLSYSAAPGYVIAYRAP